MAVITDGFEGTSLEDNWEIYSTSGTTADVWAVTGTPAPHGGAVSLRGKTNSPASTASTANHYAWINAPSITAASIEGYFYVESHGGPIGANYLPLIMATTATTADLPFTNVAMYMHTSPTALNFASGVTAAAVTGAWHSFYQRTLLNGEDADDDWFVTQKFNGVTYVDQYYGGGLGVPGGFFLWRFQNRTGVLLFDDLIMKTNEDVDTTGTPDFIDIFIPQITRYA